MKANIHPKYHEITTTCSCGEVLVVSSTLEKDIQLDVCSKCHPFYTGKHKVLDTAGRVESFNRRFRRRAGADEAEKTSDSEK